MLSADIEKKAATLERVATLEGGAPLGITALAFSRDGRYLAVASAAPDPRLALRVEASGETLVKIDLRSEATRVAFDPFDAHRVLVPHARGGVLAAHPGVTLHVVDETYHRRSVTRRPLLVPEENALTCAAWSPDGSVALGDEEGAVFAANPEDGSLVAPPESVTAAVRAALAADPSFRRARLRAGTCLMRLGAFEGARAEFLLAAEGDAGGTAAEARRLAEDAARGAALVDRLTRADGGALASLRRHCVDGASVGARRVKARVLRAAEGDGGFDADGDDDFASDAVSYTHLTLPTILLV